jgi:hypothetical protein
LRVYLAGRWAGAVLGGGEDRGILQEQVGIGEDT